MVGLITGEIGSVALEDEGINALPTSGADVRGAAASEALGGYTSRIYRAFTGSHARLETDPNGIDDRDDRIANPLTADDANKQFGIPGVLKFDKDTDEGTARGLYEDKHAQLVRQDIINRSRGDFGSGPVPQFLAASIAGMLDPIGLAAFAVPIFGEAQMGARLALAAGGAERLALRAGAGAVEGAVGMAALEPLNFVLDQHEMNDWHMGEALRNIAFGAALGAAFHAGGGALADRITGRYKPEDHAMALRGAVAQVATGEPVTVASALDAVQASRAESNLRQFAQRQTEINDRGRLPPETGVADRGAALDAATTQLRNLQAEGEALGREAATAREGVTRANMDPETAARLAAVESDLARTLPRGQRAALENERTMLLEGLRENPAAVDTLEAARSRAQAEGLETAQARTGAQAADLEARLAEMRIADAEAQAQREAALRSDDASARTEAILNASKRDVLQNLTERSIRQYAASYGVVLDAAEVRLLAREIMSAQRAEAGDAVNLVLKDIRERSPAPGQVSVMSPGPGAAVATGSAALRREGQEHMTTLTDQLRNPPEHPDTAQGRRIATFAEERAPKIEGDADAQLTEATKQAAELEAQITAEHAAGRISDGDLEAMKDATKTLAAETEEDIGIFQAAASCLMGGTG